MIIRVKFRILGIGLELACNGGSCGGISLEGHECNLHLKRLPGISLTCKLVPVQYREYENGLFKCNDHSSLSSTTAVQIWIISYILHTTYLYKKLSDNFTAQRWQLPCESIHHLGT